MKKNMGFTLVELMVVVGIIGILAAIAIPNFMVFVSKAKQAEAKVNLGAIYKCELAYFSATNTFAGEDAANARNAFMLINFIPVAGRNRYAYLIGDSSLIPSRFPLDTSLLPAGIASTSAGFTAIAAGNVDGDPDLDIWSMNNAGIIRQLHNDI